MKQINKLLLAATICLVVGCKKNEAAPSGTLSGNWILVQTVVSVETWNSRENHVFNIPLSPSQTITFDYPNTFKGTSVQDSLFSLPNYFQVSNGDIIGPALYLYRNVTSTGERGNLFTFNAAPQDTLFMRSLNGSAVLYKFRRL